MLGCRRMFKQIEPKCRPVKLYLIGMGNFGGGSIPQSNPQSPFGGMHHQQRVQGSMSGIVGSNMPPYGNSGMTNTSIQQQAHNQFMMNRQGNNVCCYIRLKIFNAFT